MRDVPVQWHRRKQDKTPPGDEWVSEWIGVTESESENDDDCWWKHPKGTFENRMTSKTPEYLEGRGRHGRMRRRDRKLWEHLVYLVSLYSLQNVKLKMTPLDAMKLMEYPEERYSVGIVVPSVAILRAVDGHQGLNEVVACWLKSAEGKRKEDQLS